MAPNESDLDAEIERLYRGPLQEFTAARNELAKRLRKSGRGEDAERAGALAKPTPSAWAVNLLFERERQKMDAMIAAGTQARAGQRQPPRRHAGPLNESLDTARRLTDELKRLGTGILAEAGRAASRETIDRLGTNLHALALSPAAAAEASRRWLDRDLDPPSFEVLAGLQLASAPVADLAARRPAPANLATREAGELAHGRRKAVEREQRRRKADEREQRRREASERARREREEERVRRRVEAASAKVERARQAASSLRQEAERAESAAAEARQRADEAEATARRARERSDRAAKGLAQAEDELRDAQNGR